MNVADQFAGLSSLTLTREHTAAEIRRADVAAQKASLPKRKSCKGGKHKSLFETGHFVVIDGEGISCGDYQERHHLDGDTLEVTKFRFREHRYIHLAAYTIRKNEEHWHEIDAASDRLSFMECAEFLLDLRRHYTRGIFITYGGNYDFIQMLAYDLSHDEITKLINEGAIYLDYIHTMYRVEYRPRKSLTITSYPKRGKRCSVIIWDAFGFFQLPFLDALLSWQIDHNRADLDLIAQGKRGREHFTLADLPSIAAYNRAELRAFFAMANALRAAIEHAGFSISRWDGAGSIAAARMTAAGIKQANADLRDEDAYDAVRRAYFGGRVEAVLIGHHPLPLHSYDLRSAYPNAARGLPSMAGGRWIRLDPDQVIDDGWTLHHVRWRFGFNAPFYPFPFRSRTMAISFPRVGEGWFWRPEIDAADRFAELYGGTIETLAAWRFVPGSQSEPFAFIDDLYSARQDLLAVHGPGGAETIMKLALTAIYGKTAQSVGAREDEYGDLILPPFHNLFWSGWITSTTRARLLDAALINPEAIIAFATDCIFTVDDLPISDDGGSIGTWKHKHHRAATFVQSGIYWLHDHDDIYHFSRGFSRRVMRDDDAVLTAWRKREEYLVLEQTRLISLATAIQSDVFWPMRGAFAHSQIKLHLDGSSNKRLPIARADQPWKRLCRTLPQINNASDCSFPCRLAWLDSEDDQEYKATIIAQQESEDSEL